MIKTLTAYLFNITKIPSNFTKNPAPVIAITRASSLEVIKILTITTELVRSVTENVLGPFLNFSRKGSTHDKYLVMHKLCTTSKSR